MTAPLTEVVHSYQVTFVFEYATLSTTVFAMHEDAAPEMAAEQLISDLPHVTAEMLDQAQDITVELLDEDVL